MYFKNLSRQTLYKFYYLISSKSTSTVITSLNIWEVLIIREFYLTWLYRIYCNCFCGCYVLHFVFAIWFGHVAYCQKHLSADCNKKWMIDYKMFNQLGNEEAKHSQPFKSCITVYFLYLYYMGFWFSFS